MGSFDLAHLLRIRCPCGRQCFPEQDLLCVECVSAADYKCRCLRSLARHTVFNNLPASIITAIVKFAADSAAQHFYIAILDYVLLTEGSPWRAFRFATNAVRPMAGNISVTEDILDRIFSFL